MLLLTLKSWLDLISRTILVVGSVLMQSWQLGSIGWECTEPVVWTTLGTTCGRCQAGLEIPVGLIMWSLVGQQDWKKSRLNMQSDHNQLSKYNHITTRATSTSITSTKTTTQIIPWPLVVPTEVKKPFIGSCLNFLSRLAFQEAAGVVIIGRMETYHTRNLARLLPLRGPETLFFYAAREVPIRIAGKTHTNTFKNLINFTMTHRLDSDILFPYGYIIPKDPGKNWAKTQSVPYLRRLTCIRWIGFFSRGVIFIHELSIN